MQITKLHFRILAATLTVFTTLGAISPAHAYYVYHGVTADAETGIVVWTQRASFGVSGQPIPTLSFNADPAAIPDAQCFVRVDLIDVDNPQTGDEALVGNPDIHFEVVDTDQPRPFPWTIVFDNNPAGHWGIAKAQMTDAATNAAAGRVAAAGFKALATTPGSNVTVINGILPNCRAQ